LRGAISTVSHQCASDEVMSKTTRFDAADYLDTEERQVAYIAAALESGDADFVRDALGLVARARGMGEIARKAGLNREKPVQGARGDRQSRIRHGHAYCSRLGSNPFSAPRGEWTDVKAAPDRVSQAWSTRWHCAVARRAQ
jgi:probable addiction module antidote protein